MLVGDVPGCDQSFCTVICIFNVSIQQVQSWFSPGWTVHKLSKCAECPFQIDDERIPVSCLKSLAYLLLPAQCPGYRSVPKSQCA